MSRICAVCDKRPHVANIVSHANNKTKRWIYPNVHTMRYRMSDSNATTVHRGSVCTKCVKARKVQKVL